LKRGDEALSWARRHPRRARNHHSSRALNPINDIKENLMRIPLSIMAMTAAIAFAAPASATERGVVGGAVAGGAVGAAVGGPVGAVVGAGTGAVVGGSITNHRRYHRYRYGYYHHHHYYRG
jgi:uncharacterized protein YcfJ